jgi:putative ABC transport system ATP-binding protein
MAEPQTIAISCQHVTKSFGEGAEKVTALQGIDMEVPQGELYMLVGPSGCGKTTLISIIAGILDQDGGECLLFGKNIKALGAHERIDFRAKNIGFVFQAFNLLPTLTAAENVAVPLIINGMARKEAVAKASEILATVGLGDRVIALPSQLSGGQQQRVAIARALVHNPKIIVCDEPTSSLDHKTGLKVLELMRNVALGGGRTLIVVTHDNRIYSFADRIAQMDDGKITKVVTSWRDMDEETEEGVAAAEAAKDIKKVAV